MVKSIYLQDGEEIFVDDEDYERVNQYTWYKSFNGNTRYVANTNGKGLLSFLVENSYQMKKGNDFTKRNLTTKGNRGRWRKANVKSKSKYKGVSWDETHGKWCAAIIVDGKNKNLGRYLNKDDAARAYNQAVLDYWDGNGYLNVIGEDNRTSKRQYNINSKQNIRRSKSGYKGVVQYSKKFYVSIYYKNKTNHGPIFNTVHRAALAYNKCVLYLYGDDAILNDVQMTDELKEFISNWEIPDKIKQLKED